MESKSLTPMQTFTERLQTKIRDDIAGLIPDEVIAEMVKKATQSLFFEKKFVERQRTDGRYGTESVAGPSEFENLVLKEVGKILQVEADKALKAWSADNPGRIEELVRETIEKGLAEMVMKSLSIALSGLFLDSSSILVANLRSSLKNGGY